MDMTGGIEGPSGGGGVNPQDRVSGSEGAARASGSGRVEGTGGEQFLDRLSSLGSASAAAGAGALDGTALERLGGRIRERLNAGDSRGEILESLVRGELKSSQGSDRAAQFVMEKVQEDPALSELFEQLVRHVEGQNSKGEH